MSDENPPVLHIGIGPPTTCRSCKAPIVFARMATSGKLSPFERDADGEWVIANGEASHQGKAPAFQPEGNTIPRWTSHFSRCPNAKSWRKR
jgi:hypothetical protein